jgi:hypothetical protein
MEVAFISIPLRSGYVFKAWKYGVDCILPNKKNVMRVDALRTITGKEGDPVDHSLRTWIEKYEFDIFGISEVNMFWPRVKPELQFIDRVYSWFNPPAYKSNSSIQQT